MANALSAQFVEHIIFIRKQIPCTYLDLMKHADEEAQRRQIQKQGRRLSASFQKKALRFVQDMEIAFRSLQKHFPQSSPYSLFDTFRIVYQQSKRRLLLDFCTTGGLWHEYSKTISTGISKNHMQRLCKWFKRFISVELKMRPRNIYCVMETD